MSFSFKTWPFPSSSRTSHILICSQYGLIAHASNNNLAIYVEEYGHSTPLVMWSPFEHNITALAWYDASRTIYNTVPVLVLASESGKFEVFDCRSRRSIFISRVNSNIQPMNDSLFSFQYPTPVAIQQNIANARRESDYITTIKWSQFSPSCFFVGTKNGRLIRFDIIIGPIVNCKVVWELFFDFQIDHICIEPQFGEICAVASESGSVATINNINKFDVGKAPEASPYVVSLSNKTDFIHEIKFYPTSTEFLILVTTSNSLLYSIHENCTAPLLPLPGIRKFYNIHDSRNIALIVRDNSVELWEFLSNQNKRLAEAKMTTLTKIGTQREILVSDMMGDKLVMITSQMWLTTLEVKFSSKLFITRRVKLLDAKPMSFSFANESIAIATAIGNVLVTATSNPNFVAQMTYKAPLTNFLNQGDPLNLQKQSQDEQEEQNESLKEQDKQISNQNEENASTKSNEKDDKPNEQDIKDEIKSPIKSKPTKQVTFLDQNNQIINNQKDNTKKVPTFLSSNPSTNQIALTESASAPILKLSESDNSSSSSMLSSLKQNKRMRRSIFNSCASSSSFFLDALDENIPQNEEILDKSIVMNNPNTKINANTVSPLNPHNDNQTNSSINSHHMTIVSRPFQNPPASVVNANLGKKRRVSSITTDALKNSTILSRVMNEGMKNMSKEASALNVAPAAPNPTPDPHPRPIPSMPTSIPKIPKESPQSEPRPRQQLQSQNIQSLPKFSAPMESIPKFSTQVQPNELQKNRVQQVSTKVISKYKFGNNCSIMWNYQIAKNTKIEHIEWIASTRVIIYNLSTKCTETNEKVVREDSELNLDNTFGSSHLLPRYSGASFIYLIDFKYHRVTRLFDKPGINISDITFSANKQYFFVTINGFMVVLFQNKQNPKKIHSFQFESNVFVAFIAYYLIFVDANGNIHRNRFELGQSFELKMTKSQIKLKKEYGQITCIIGKKSNIYMGTTTGYVLNVDSNTLHISEVLLIKSSIVSIKPGSLDSTLIKDAKGNMITLTSDGESFTLPVGIKTAILTSPTTLLVRRKKKSFIEVYQTIGQYVPSYPKAAARCPMMMPPNRWFRSLMNEDPIDQAVLLNYGLSYLAGIANSKRSPKFTYEQVYHLRNLIMDTPQLWKTAYSLSLFLRDFEIAQTIIVTNSTPNANEQDWAINIMKCASFVEDDKLKETRVDAILFAGTNLIKNHYISDGVDILIAAGLWVDAVKMLARLGMVQEAAKITRVYCDNSTLDVLNEVTMQMFKQPNNICYALTMLCEKGLEKQTIQELENLGQFEAAKVLAKVLNEMQ